MRVVFVCFLLCIAISGKAHYPPLPQVTSEEEALWVRRILEFWKDKEFGFVKNQIDNFLATFPESVCHDHFCALAGDIALYEEDYAHAIECYALVSNPEFLNHVQLKKWEALYHMGKFAELFQETAPIITTSNAEAEQDEVYFYYAEGAFREGLALMEIPDQSLTGMKLLQDALPYYEKLLSNNQFKSHAKLALAEIYKRIGQSENARNLYLQISEEGGSTEILFHAASMLSVTDKAKAIQLFSEIAQKDEKFKEEAAYQWLMLLAENENWKAIAEAREIFSSCLSAERSAVGSFYLGMIAFEEGKFEQASLDLQKCLDAGLPPQHERRALVNLMAACCALKNLKLGEKTLDQIADLFPQAYPESCLMLAAACHKAGETENALQLLDNIAEGRLAEKVIVEKIRILKERQAFSEAHDYVLAYLKNHPETSQRAYLMHQAIDLSLAQLSQENVYEQLADDLKVGIESNLFTTAEKKEKIDLLAKTYLQLDRVQEALQILLTQQDPDPLLLAHCYIKDGKDLEKMIQHGEEALECYPEEKTLHVHLFNAYLVLSQKEDEATCKRHAAAHLGAVIDSYPVNLSNRLWLIHYYAKEDFAKAIPLLEKLLAEPGYFERFDEEAQILGNLYFETHQWEKAAEFLEKISLLPQKSSQKAKLLLAEVYLAQKKTLEARALYSTIEISSNLETAFMARLQLARLNFPDEPEASLKKLYELAERKSIDKEPIHLEAALDYAELKSSLYSESERAKQHLALLKAVKHDFTKQDNIWSKDYHASRAHLPDKDLVYQAYMRYLDACIYMLEADLANDPMIAKTKKNAAKALFSTLRQGKYAVSHYLKEHATKGFYE